MGVLAKAVQIKEVEERVTDKVRVDPERLSWSTLISSVVVVSFIVDILLS